MLVKNILIPCNEGLVELRAYTYINIRGIVYDKIRRAKEVRFLNRHCKFNKSDSTRTYVKVC